LDAARIFTGRGLSMLIRHCVFLLMLPAAASSGMAGSLQVSPVNVEVFAPAAAAVIKARNDGARPLTVQIRVYRWSQDGGRERMEQTTDVVASPPMAKIPPAGEYTIRVVRLDKLPNKTEESFRLVVDEIPDRMGERSGAVNLVVRQSIPVFFRPMQAGRPNIDWTIERRAGEQHLVAVNHGDRRLRLAKVVLRDRSGTTVSFGNGLTGYVLAKSSMSWPFPAGSSLGTRGVIELSALTDLGPMNASIAPPGR
jgi:fimbrial chaperone protein